MTSIYRFVFISSGQAKASVKAAVLHVSRIPKGFEEVSAQQLTNTT
jgi:hypothetical protein